jgi:5'-nucleotidase
MNKKRIFIDMDGVLADFERELKNTERVIKELNLEHLNAPDEVNFSKIKPLPNAITSYIYLFNNFDVYIASTAPWANSKAWRDKREWVENYLGGYARKRLILTHNKNLLNGDYLIDDRTANGAGEFEGKLIQFGSKEYPDWKSVIDYFAKKYPNQKPHNQ